MDIIRRTFRRNSQTNVPPLSANDEDNIQVVIGACIQNDINLLRRCISPEKAQNFIFGRSKRSLLHVSAGFGSIDCVKYLLSLGVDVNKGDHSNATPIILAARNGHFAIFKLLLEKYHADTTIQDQDGYSCIHWLAQNGRIKMLQYAIDKLSPQVLLLIDHRGATPLHLAAQNGHSSTVEMMLSFGVVSRDVIDSKGNSLLHYACQYSQVDCIRILAKLGCNLIPNFDGQTPFEIAVQSESDSTLATLLEHFPQTIIKPTVNLILSKPLLFEKVMERISTIQSANSLKIIKKVLIDSSSLLSSKGMEALCSNSPNSCAEIFNAGLKAYLQIETYLKLDSKSHASVHASFQAVWHNLFAWLDVVTSQSQDQFDKVVAAKLCILTASFHEYMFATKQIDAATLMLAGSKSAIETIASVASEDFLYHLHYLASTSETLREAVLSLPKDVRIQWFLSLFPVTESDPTAKAITVKRDEILQSSCSLLMNLTQTSVSHGLAIRFENEDGVGNGVKREWFTVIWDQLLDLEAGLFTIKNGFICPSIYSVLQDNLEDLFRFVGKLLALCILDRKILNLGQVLSPQILCALTDTKMTLSHVEQLDESFAHSLNWVLDNDLSEADLDMTFTVDLESLFGPYVTKELIESGDCVLVREDNKQEFVDAVIFHKFVKPFQLQLGCLAEGFHELIDKKYLACLTDEELGSLLVSSCDIDIDALQSTTSYVDCDETSPSIELFWKCVEEMSQDDQHHLVRFVTGQPSWNQHLNSKWTIVGVPEYRLPSASTCFSMFRLPLLTTEVKMKACLETVVQHCGEEFALV